MAEASGQRGEKGLQRDQRAESRSGWGTVSGLAQAMHSGREWLIPTSTRIDVHCLVSIARVLALVAMVSRVLHVGVAAACLPFTSLRGRS